MTTRLIDLKEKRHRHEWSQELEYCVVCGAETPFQKATPVALRTDYVEGIGQLCCRCAAELWSEELYTRQNGHMCALSYYVNAESL